MVDLNLVNYIRQLLQMGYNINDVRTRLITSGYNTQLVDEAINYVYQPTAEQPSAPKPRFTDHFKSKKFLIVTAAIIGLVAVSLLALTFLGGSAPMDMKVYLGSSSVIQGDELSFTKTVMNADGAGMVMFEYEVIDAIMGGNTASAQESFSTQSIPRQTSITIPADTAPGQYQLIVSAKYGSQSIDTRSEFTVIEGTKPSGTEQPGFEPGAEPEAPPIAAAPDNDNDGTPDDVDTDDDNDNIPDLEDASPMDHDNDGIPDALDDDIDNDGITNRFDNYFYDGDNDGVQDYIDDDNDNDGIPDSEDAYIFDYDNDGVSDKDDNDAGRSYSLSSEQVQAEITNKCTGAFDCNDFDICTTDSCVEGFCEHARQTPCCGNSICESGESPDTCSLDCREAAAGGKDRAQVLIDEIMATAASNPERAASSCEKIESTETFDRCYIELAKTSKNSQFCSQVYEPDSKDRCFMHFVMGEDKFELCDKIEKRILKNSCFSLKNLKSSG